MKSSIFTKCIGLLFSIGLLCMQQLTAQIKLADLIPFDAAVKVGVLPNGLRYYIRSNQKPEKKVEMRLVINAGSILENEKQLGLAHFMEHMNFNGTKHFPKNELVDFLQKNGVKFGADLNASTSFDETMYMLPLPSNEMALLDKGLTVLEDWAFNNLFDTAEINRERGVVLKELRLSKGAQDRLRQQYFPQLLNGSLYASRLPIGTEAVLKNFQPEDLIRFYKTWYRPNLMAIIVVGDIDVMAMEKMITQHFSGYANPVNEVSRPAMVPIAPRNNAAALVLTDEEQPNTIVQQYNAIFPYTAPKVWNELRTKVLDQLIGVMLSQRLQEKAQTANPPFLFAGISKGGFVRGYEAETAVALTADSNVSVALQTLMEEASKVKQYGFLPAEIERAKAALLNQAERQMLEKDKTNSSRFVSMYVAHFLTGEPLPGETLSHQFMKEHLPGVSVSEINAAAAAYTFGGNSFTLVQAPAAAKKKLPTSNDVLEIVKLALQKKASAYEETAVASTLMKEMPKAGKIVSITRNSKLGTMDIVFSNGVSATIKATTFKADEILMDARRIGGYNRFPLADKFAASEASSIIEEIGVGGFDPVALNKFKAGKSFSLSSSIGATEERLSGRSSVKDFSYLLQLAYLYSTSPNNNPALFTSYNNKSKGLLAFMANDPNSAFFDTLQSFAYKNNAWRDKMPLAKDYDQLTLDKVMKLYKATFGNAYGFHVTLVGNIDTTSAGLQLLATYLGGLPGNAYKPTTKDVGLRMRNTQVNQNFQFKKGKEQQALVVMQKEGVAKTGYAESLKLEALMEVLNIQLTEIIREKLGAAYTAQIGAKISLQPWVHYEVAAYIPCGPENVALVKESMEDIIKQAIMNGVSKSDLDKVKENWKKKFETNSKENGFWLQTLASSKMNKQVPIELLQYQQLVEKLTVGDLQQAAKTYLSGGFIWGVRLPEDK